LGILGTKINEILEHQNILLSGNKFTNDWLEKKFIFLESSVRNNMETVTISMSNQLGKLELKIDGNGSLLRNVITSINILSANYSEGNFNETNLINNVHDSIIQDIGKSQENQFEAIKCAIEISDGKLWELIKNIFNQFTFSLNSKTADDRVLQDQFNTMIVNEIASCNDAVIEVKGELADLHDHIMTINGGGDKRQFTLLRMKFLSPILTRKGCCKPFRTR
jgi:hypothetical protein